MSPRAQPRPALSHRGGADHEPGTKPFSWRFTTPLFIGSPLNPINRASGSQTALYTQAPADHLGTASGLLRTFGYVGSIASSAITGTVFHGGVSDHGLHIIGWIMVGVSAVLVLVTLADRTLRTLRGHGRPEAA